MIGLTILAILLLTFGFAKAIALVVVMAVATGAVPIDLAPLVNGILVPILTPLIGAALLWVIYKVAAVFHFVLQDGQRSLLDRAIANGLNWAAQKASTTPMVVSAQPGVVADVASYLGKTAPGALKSLGLDKDSEALAAAITARLPVASPK